MLRGVLAAAGSWNRLQLRLLRIELNALSREREERLQKKLGVDGLRPALFRQRHARIGELRAAVSLKEVIQEDSRRNDVAVG